MYKDQRKTRHSTCADVLPEVVRHEARLLVSRRRTWQTMPAVADRRLQYICPRLVPHVNHSHVGVAWCHPVSNRVCIWAWPNYSPYLGLPVQHWLAEEAYIFCCWALFFCHGNLSV